MALQPGQPLLGHQVDVVFIGSCTNSRISDLRLAAGLLEGRRVAPGVRMLVVPGSQDVKKQAEAEGLDDIFKRAGAEWREAGCSMCIAMNGDQLEPGQYAVSTSNRNFEGRQGKGGRTFLASPLTAAATAITGKITDVRTMLSCPVFSQIGSHGSIHEVQIARGRAPVERHRHRSDHPRALSQDDRQGRARRGAVRRLALQP